MKKKLLLALTAFLLACTFANAETLEERVERLERELKETKQELSKQISEKQTSSPSFNVSNITDGFEFHGYGRAGILIDQKGEKGQAFRVKDAGSVIPNAERFAQKYRLGNEDDTYVLNKSRFRK